MSAYEIVALGYATHARPASENFLYPAAAGEDPHDYPMPIDYFVWVIRNGETPKVLVDTGSPSMAQTPPRRRAAALY